jgi:metal-responsive CopG/Arc/MetJ family transcriptional regulator
MSKRITVSLPDDVHDRLNDRLDYGDNRSEWVAEAIVEKLDREADEGNPKATPATAD